MSRPIPNEIQSALQSWDTLVDQNFNAIFERPFPVPNGPSTSPYTSVGELPSAGSYDGCFAVVDNGGTWELYYSDGTSWKRAGYASDDNNIGAIVDGSGGTAGGSAGARSIGTVTNVATAQDAIATLAAWCNELHAAMTASGLIE